MTPSDKLREIAESSFVNISDEMKYIQKLLPDHYRCEQRGNGVRCISDIGINEVTEEGYWRVFIIALKVRYRDRFMEVFHQTCSDHKEFTVYIKEQSMADKLSAFAEKWSTEIAGNYDDELDVVTMLTNEDELLSDLTALISENYVERAKYDEAVRQRDELKEALADMVNQFAYETQTDGGGALYTGGLSALENAFCALGLSDPITVLDFEAAIKNTEG